MRILVCVKRVPLTGGRMVLTADEQAIETRHLGFTISPHEECGVEQAVRLVEQHGGETTVLTLGPAEAEEQVRDCLAIGADRGILLLAEGEEWDPQATAAAIVEAVQAEQAAGGDFDLIVFGNESADSGGYQVGIRVAHALGRPIATGLKGLSIEGGRARCEQEVAGGRDVYLLPLPAVASVLEGINLPRYPSVPAKLRARKKQVERRTPARAGSRLEKLRLVVPAGQGKQAEILGRGPDAAPAVVDVMRELGGGVMGVLVLVEHEGRQVDELSLQALALARALGDPVALLIGAGGREAAGTLGPQAVATAYVAEDERLATYAPGAWARAVGDALERSGATAVVAAGTNCGNEVMAHVAARRDLPFAANCTAVGSGAGGGAAASDAAAGGALDVTRVRWGGSLLEEARVHGDLPLLTVAPHTVAATAVNGAGAPAIESFAPALDDADLVVRVAEHVDAVQSGVSLAEAKVVVSGGRGVGSADGFGILEELAALLDAAVGCSRVVTSAGWRPHTDQVGQTGTKVSPDLYIACGISGATQHIAGCKGAKKILAINADDEAPILNSADYAVIGDLTEIVPAITAELRRARSQ